MIGKTLGNYEIREPLGAGGMGEVYRAHDVNLERDVAVKVLPTEMSHDADRLRRLEREAHLLASLNHPNIATIFGLEQIDGTRFLVLELIEGESLQQRLGRGPLPLEEALDICGQIARALEVAHEADIVHRDLKPGNVLITPDGRAKVLDFGIAKTLTPVEDDDPAARATELTAAGTLVGTAPYMSPEQVRGEPVDKRSDLWAFGCILFEALAGNGPFTRATMADTLAAIVGEEPPWDALPAEVSPAVRMLLHRCLQKNPTVRQRHIGDAWVEINQTRSHPGGVPMSMPPTMAAAHGPRTRASVAAGLVVAALAVGALLGWWLGAEMPVRESPRYFDFDLPMGAAFPAGAGPTIAISPDGNRVVMVVEDAVGRRLWLHRLDQRGEPQPLEGTEGALYPFFSPDGALLAYDAPNGSVEWISLEGGDADTLCRQCRHGAWGDDGSIFVQVTADTSASPWARIAEPGADIEELPVPRLNEETLLPDRMDILPGSRAVLFQDADEDVIYAYSLATQEVVEVLKNATDPFYAGGYVLFPRDFTLYALPFDADTLRASGAPIVAEREVNTEAGGALHAAVSRDNGVLAFAPVVAARALGFSLRWVDRTGAWEEISTDDEHIGIAPRVSPDGTRIAYGMAPDPAGIWLIDDATKVPEPFHVVDHVTISRLLNHAAWARDGRSITFVELRNPDPGGAPGREMAIVRKELGGARSSETLRAVPAGSTHSFAPAGWTPDGRLIYGVATRAPHILSPAADAAARDTILFESEFETGAYALSHDGNWLTYVSRRFGSDAVYVRPFPDGDEIPVSSPGGSEPRWGPDDRELFYVAGGKLRSAHVRVTDGTFTVDSHEELFDLTEYPGYRGVTRYDVHPDGNRFAMIRPDSVDSSYRIHVVTNWLDRMQQQPGERR